MNSNSLALFRSTLPEGKKRTSEREKYHEKVIFVSKVDRNMRMGEDKIAGEEGKRH